MPQPKLGCPVLLHEIISTLFPPGQTYTFISRASETTYTVPYVLAACSGIGEWKTSGLDGIPNKALKAAVRLRPNMFTRVFHRSFVEGVFPRNGRNRNWFSFQNLANRQGNHRRIGPSAYLAYTFLSRALETTYTR